MLWCARAAWPHLLPRRRAFFPRYATDARMPLELDKLDRKILAIIQRDAGRKAEAIGAAVGLSSSAVQRRIARLREAKVIKAEVAIIDPASVGRPLTVIVDVEVERERPELLAAFQRWIAEESAIQEAWYVTGDGDYVLVLTARDVADYDRLMQQMLADNANVRCFHTRVALGTLKRGWAVPVDASADE